MIARSGPICALLGYCSVNRHCFRGRVLSADELAATRREIQSFDSMEAIDDEMRALILRNWPDVAAKLPPEQ